MPSFVCNRCQETLKKPKLDTHVQRCRGASFSCIDCYRDFKGVEYREHFSCITEAEKYEKKKVWTSGQAVGWLLNGSYSGIVGQSEQGRDEATSGEPSTSGRSGKEASYSRGARLASRRTRVRPEGE